MGVKYAHPGRDARYQFVMEIMPELMKGDGNKIYISELIGTARRNFPDDPAYERISKLWDDYMKKFSH